MRILYITTIGGTMGFFKSFISNLIKCGHQVDLATNEDFGTVPECFREWGCNVYPIHCSRSPVNKGNIKAIREIKRIVKENHFDIVHCHTPIAAACTRIACRCLRKKNGMRVFYTAHGFHFYSGAPLKNWLLYFPIEWFCSFFTDVLITINREDYNRARQFLHAKNVKYIPGVGIDLNRFKKKVPQNNIRDEYRINNYFLLSVGELNSNKNHENVIKAIKGLDITYVVVGDGILKEKLQIIAKENGVNLILAGYRTNVIDFYNSCDGFVLPSFREGLNVSLMEAMACSLPCAASRIRGNTDLINDGQGGYLFDPKSIGSIRASIVRMQEDYSKFGFLNRKKIESFSIDNINKVLMGLYLQYMGF